MLDVKAWKIYWAFNLYWTKFQTICFSLNLLTIHFFLKNQPFACLIKLMPLHNLHIAAKGFFQEKM
jgi:hypothetical protein